MKLSKYLFLFNKITIVVLLILLFKYINPIFNPPEWIYPDHVYKTLYVDRNFSKEERAEITAAAQAWQDMTHGIVKYEVVKLPTFDEIDIKNSVLISKISSDDPALIEINNLDTFSRNTLGYYFGEGKLKYIAIATDNFDISSLKAVMEHELGHQLGLVHTTGVDGVGTLMYPSADFGADHITQEDLENFCKLYHCDASKLGN